MTLLSFHGSEEIKAKYVDRVKVHTELDHLIQGEGWNGERGCAIGCTLENYSHSAYETELGIPEWLAHVEDKLFEGMSVDDSRLWPSQFLEAIQPGKDLNVILGPLMIFVLHIALDQFDHEKYPDCKKVIDDVILLWQSNEKDLDKFRKAANAAANAANAAYAAYAANATNAAAYAAAANAASRRIADKLLELLKSL